MKISGYVVNPNDGDLVDAFGDWVTDPAMRRQIMVDTPASFSRFWTLPFGVDRCATPARPGRALRGRALVNRERPGA
jgi:hypothetical protein